MIKMNKQLWKKMSAMLIVGLGILIGIPSALADDTGAGTGGGSSSGSLRGNVHWTSIANNERGKAWEQFLAMESATGRNIETLTKVQVKNRVGNINVCENSRVIWYLKHDKSSRWVYNYSQETHGTPWNNISINKQKSSIENPSEVRGSRAANDAEIAKFKEWDKNTNGNLIDKSPGYVIICSGRFDEQVTKPDLSETYPEEKFDSNSVVYTFNEIRSYKTDVTPQLSEYNEKGELVDPIGADNLNVQSTGNSRTNYGVAIDNILEGKNTGLDIEKTKTALENAIAKDKARSLNAPINLNDNNQAGMAEGGVLNINERTSKAKITLTREDSIKLTRICTKTQTWNKTTGLYNPVKITCPSTWDETVTKGAPEVNKELPTQQNTGFWQMLSVHCNPEEFAALIKNTPGATKVSQGSVREGIAAAATTKTYTQQPAHLDFGDSLNSKIASAASANLGFYDKECPFDCTPSSNTSDGASTKNGATTNVGTGGSTANTYKGALSSNVNDNGFDFFRDNNAKTIKVNVWYPQEEGVTYDGAAPLSTTVTRWAEGTPGTTGNNGGKFTMKAVKGKTATELFTGKGKATTQKNWNTSTFDTANSTSLPGMYNTFTVQSTWASDKDKPQQLNFKYEYAPKVNTTIYTNGLGFQKDDNGKSVQILGATKTVSAAIEGKCYVNYSNTDTQIDTTEAFGDNTGTGTTNNLDGKLVEGSGQEKKTNLTVNFVRATAE